MSRKVMFAGILVLILVASIAPMAVSAQSATGQTWSTAITYYTPDATGGTLQITYYPEGGGAAIPADPITLSGHKAGSLFIGNVPGMSDTFGGGAVMLADVPIVATAVNIAGDSADYPRTLYSGFDPSQASTDFFIPTVLYQQFGQTTLLSIQNVEDFDIDATLKVYATGSSIPSFEETYPIAPQAAELIPAAEMGLAAGFSGSAVVSADGRVVAAAQETDDAGRGAKAFEGLAADAGATDIYMASMMCRAYANKQISYYAIQNVGQSQAAVEIEFWDKNAALVHTATGLTIDAGNKISKNPCNFVGDAPGLEGIVGSAVIKSTNGVPLVAMGKISSESKDMTPTAFLGASQGAYSIAAPYIRWKTDPAGGERAYIAVMNVGTVAATDITATYYNTDGTPTVAVLADGTSPLDPFVKVNTNWGLHGTGGDFGGGPPWGGAVEISSDQPVVVVVRVSKEVSLGSITKFAEDYNGVSVP